MWRVFHGYNSDIRPLYDPRARSNILLLHAGDNDVVHGLKADEIYSLVRQFVATAHRDGWQVVATTELPRYDFHQAAFDELQRFNELIRLNGAGADAVADFAADPIVGGRERRSDPRYYTPDKVHPADAGYAILARLTADAIGRFTEATKTSEHTKSTR